MDTNNPLKLERDDPMWAAAQVIENSVRAIRKARGKKNPEDCIRDTSEYVQVLEEFLHDVLAAIADVEDEADSQGVSSAG